MGCSSRPSQPRRNPKLRDIIWQGQPSQFEWLVDIGSEGVLVTTVAELLLAGTGRKAWRPRRWPNSAKRGSQYEFHVLAASGQEGWPAPNKNITSVAASHQPPEPDKSAHMKPICHVFG